MVYQAILVIEIRNQQSGSYDQRALILSRSGVKITCLYQLLAKFGV